MKKSFSQIFTMLAASDVNLSDLNEFFHWVTSRRPSRATSVIEEIRHDIRKYDRLVFEQIEMSRGILEIDSIESTSRRIEQLLLAETGISKASAARKILLELRERPKVRKPLPAYNKGSFEKWLRRMVEAVGPNEMLQAASRIRSNSSSSKLSHWPLRRE